MWVVVGMKGTRMVYLLYEDGSRSEKVILDELGGCRGIIQSDGYSPYRKLEGVNIRTSPESHAFSISNVSFWIAEKKMKMQDESLT